MDWYFEVWILWYVDFVKDSFGAKFRNPFLNLGTIVPRIKMLAIITIHATLNFPTLCFSTLSFRSSHPCIWKHTFQLSSSIEQISTFGFHIWGVLGTKRGPTLIWRSDVGLDWTWIILTLSLIVSTSWKRTTTSSIEPSISPSHSLTTSSPSELQIKPITSSEKLSSDQASSVFIIESIGALIGSIQDRQSWHEAFSTSDLQRMSNPRSISIVNIPFNNLHPS